MYSFILISPTEIKIRVKAVVINVNDIVKRSNTATPDQVSFDLLAGRQQEG